jgi:predicted nucleic acid-binding protein
MIVLDTSILVYATGVEHPLRGPCRELIGRVAAGRLAATTTPEVIQEFAHVRSRRLPRREAVRLARDMSSLFEPLIVTDHVTLALGLRIYEESTVLGAFDAVLCAAALTLSVEALVSADRAFATVDGLRHVDPAWTGFAAWLDGVATGGPEPA